MHGGVVDIGIGIGLHGSAIQQANSSGETPLGDSEGVTYGEAVQQGIVQESAGPTYATTTRGGHIPEGHAEDRKMQEYGPQGDASVVDPSQASTAKPSLSDSVPMSVVGVAKYEYSVGNQVSVDTVDTGNGVLATADNSSSQSLKTCDADTLTMRAGILEDSVLPVHAVKPVSARTGPNAIAAVKGTKTDPLIVDVGAPPLKVRIVVPPIPSARSRTSIGSRDAGSADSPKTPLRRRIKPNPRYEMDLSDPRTPRFAPVPKNFVDPNPSPSPKASPSPRSYGSGSSGGGASNRSRSKGKTGSNNGSGRRILGNHTQRIFGQLMDAGSLSEGMTLTYELKAGEVMLVGTAKKEGILCSHCGAVVTLTLFERHAGSTRNRPSHNVYLPNRQTVWEAYANVLASMPMDVCADRLIPNADGAGQPQVDLSDDTCRICGDPGELLCCDGCPATFHLKCHYLDEVPSGSFFCLNCRCCVCDGSEFSSQEFNDDTILYCDQCEREFHVKCLRNSMGTVLTSLPEGAWFCRPECERIHDGFANMLSKELPAGNGYSWVLLNDAVEDKRGRRLLAQALKVIQDSFTPILDPFTKQDVIPLIVHGRQHGQLDYRGFYCAVLVDGGKVVTAATLRVFGQEVAELPLIATEESAQRSGYCKILVRTLEQLLMSYGVKQFELPAVESLQETWSRAFKFRRCERRERYELSRHGVLAFPGTFTMVKLLSPETLTDPPRSTGNNQLQVTAAGNSKDDTSKKGSRRPRATPSKRKKKRRSSPGLPDSPCSSLSPATYSNTLLSGSTTSSPSTATATHGAFPAQSQRHQLQQQQSPSPSPSPVDPSSLPPVPGKGGPNVATEVTTGQEAAAQSTHNDQAPTPISPARIVSGAELMSGTTHGEQASTGGVRQPQTHSVPPQELHISQQTVPYLQQPPSPYPLQTLPSHVQNPTPPHAQPTASPSVRWGGEAFPFLTQQHYDLACQLARHGYFLSAGTSGSFLGGMYGSLFAGSYAAMSDSSHAHLPSYSPYHYQAHTAHHHPVPQISDGYSYGSAPHSSIGTAAPHSTGSPLSSPSRTQATSVASVDSVERRNSYSPVMPVAPQSCANAASSSYAGNSSTNSARPTTPPVPS
eukprot:Rmarinus@m.19206